MRFAYQLIGLVALTSLQASKGVCVNGLPGVQRFDVCCEESCGTCGGVACQEREGGRAGCCGTQIRNSGRVCSTTSEAPCIIDDTPAPEGFCANGVPGVQRRDICCEAQCGTCGGVGCEERDGGEDGCCGTQIRNSGRVCSTTSQAPCVIVDTPESEGFCANGVPGVQRRDICCEAQCGTCGGVGCEERDGGEDGCCGTQIRNSGRVCSTTPEAPCVIDTPKPGVFCTNGVPGVQRRDVCCEAQCGTCGGIGCEERDGGEAGCCGTQIRNSGRVCSTTSEAPCIIVDTSAECRNGVPGLELANVCCEAQCGLCGGSNCFDRPGGLDGCCGNPIMASGKLCSDTLEAPCIIDGLCSNGVPGVQGANVCCEAECGTCGGEGCSERAGGPDGCCDDTIRDSGALCSTTSEAPCIIDGSFEGLCSNGLPGVQRGNICCDSECGTCGGEDCSKLPGGQDRCCDDAISDNGEMCSATSEAPCIIDGVDEPICSNGVAGVGGGGNLCCEAQCGVCGGRGCFDRPGGQDGCCDGPITNSGRMCSTTGEAPCVIDN